jgi:ribosomal protein L40E
VATGSKRVLKDSQRDNLTKKLCRECGEDMPCASKSCKKCNAKQLLKSEIEQLALQAPMQPYLGCGKLPKEQDSPQALANVRKRLEKADVRKLVSGAGGPSYKVIECDKD